MLSILNCRAVGGIIGFALVFGGGQAVQWATPDPASFPPYKVCVDVNFTSPGLCDDSVRSVECD